MANACGHRPLDPNQHPAGHGDLPDGDFRVETCSGITSAPRQPVRQARSPTPPGRCPRVLKYCLIPHLSRPRARVCTCTYPHTAPRAHAPPLCASCSPTGAHPLEAPAPVSFLPLAHSRSLCSGVPSSRLICLLCHSCFRSLLHLQPCPFLYTDTLVGTLLPSLCPGL